MESSAKHRGVIYCAVNSPQYLEASIISAIALRYLEPNLPITLISNLPHLDLLDLSPFNIQTKAIAISAFQSDSKALRSRFVKTGLPDFSPYKETLYLDADIIPLQPIQPIWDYINDTQLALALDINPSLGEATYVAPDEKEFTLSQCASNTTQYNSGVFLWKNTAKTRMLFSLWRQEWAQFQQKDQLALIRALHKFNLPVTQLPESYNFPIVKFIQNSSQQNGNISLLHCWGRVQSGEFSQIAQDLAPEPTTEALAICRRYYLTLRQSEPVTAS